MTVKNRAVALAVFVLALAGGARTAEAQALGYAIAGPAGHFGFFGTSAMAGHAAGGAELLLRNRVGVRVELRDHIRLDDRGNVHYWSIRAGVIVR